MSWSTPHTFAVGEIATASTMNTYISNDLAVLAPPDGVSSPGLWLLWDSVTAGVSLPAATITTPTISGSYKHLRCYLSGRSNGAVVNTLLSMRFNGDSGSNYDWFEVKAINTGSLVQSGVGGGSSMQLSATFPGASATAGYRGSCVIEIPAYTDMTFYKTYHAQAWGADGTNLTTEAIAGGWRSTSAITSVSFALASGSFNSGTRVTLYGVA